MMLLSRFSSGTPKERRSVASSRDEHGLAKLRGQRTTTGAVELGKVNPALDRSEDYRPARTSRGLERQHHHREARPRFMIAPNRSGDATARWSSGAAAALRPQNPMSAADVENRTPEFDAR